MAKMCGTPTLVKLIMAARRKLYSRKMTGFPIDRLDPNGKHLFGQSFPHGDAECIRSTMYLKVIGSDEPVMETLDCPIEMFNNLPNAPDV